jgi:hypothetical protein
MGTYLLRTKVGLAIGIRHDSGDRGWDAVPESLPASSCHLIRWPMIPQIDRNVCNGFESRGTTDAATRFPPRYVDGRHSQMSKRSRRRPRPIGRQHPQQRQQPVAVAERGLLAKRWPVLVVAAAAIVIVIVVVAIATNRPATGPIGPASALQTGAPPWAPDNVNLRARLVADGLQVLTAEGQVQHTHQHLDLFVDGQRVAIPPDIGIDRVNLILSPIHTHDASGIIHVESPIVREFTLGEFFDVWGVRFDGHCVGGVCDGSGRVLSVYRNGQPVTSDPRSIVLDAHEEIVVAIGTTAQLPGPIPASYVFPAGL